MNLQKTIAEKSRQIEGLMTRMHDMRHELSLNSESKETETAIELREKLALSEAKVKSLEVKYSAMKEKAERKEEELVEVVMEHGREMESGEILGQRVEEIEKLRERDVEKLSQGLDKKTKRIEELVKERQALQADVDRLLDENHRVSEALRFADVKNTELALRNESLEETNDQKGRRVREAAESASQWEKKAKEWKRSVEKLNREKDELIVKMREEDGKHREKEKNLDKEVNQLRSQLEQSGREIGELAQQVEAVERLVTHRTQQQMKNLTGQLVKKSRIIEQLKQTNASLKNQCKLAERNSEELRAALDGSSLNVTQLTSALDEVRAENATLSEQVSKMNSTLSSFEGEKAEVSRSWSISSDLSTVSFKRLDVSAAGDVSQRFAEKLENLEQRHEKQCEIGKRKDEELSALKKSYKAVAKAKEKASRALTEAEREAGRLRNQVETIGRELSGGEEEMRKMRAEFEREINELKSLLETVNEEKGRVEADLTRRHRAEVTQLTRSMLQQRQQVVAEVKSLQEVAQNEIRRIVHVLAKEKDDAVAAADNRRRVEVQQWIDYSIACRRRVGEAETEIVASATTEVDRIGDERRRVVSTARSVATTNEESRVVLAEKEARIRELAADVEAMGRRKDELRDEREASLVEKLVRVEEQCRELVLRESSSSALGSLYEQLGGCTKQLRRLEGEIGRQERERRVELGGLRDANRRLVQENVGLKNGRAKLVSENLALKGANEELMGERRELVAELKGVRLQYEQLKTLGKSKREFGKSSEGWVELANADERLKLENERLKDELSSCVERLKGDKDKVKTKLKLKKRQANYLRIRLGGLISENRQLKQAMIQR